MGHRVATLDCGVMQQVDEPNMLYKYPANLFVASFIGSPAMNLIPTAHDGETVAFGSVRLPLDPAVKAQLAGLGTAEVTAGVRPQGLAPGPDGVPAKVVVVEELGSETFVFVEMEAQAASQYYSTDPAVVEQEMIGAVPLRRVGSLDEVANTVVWLLSDESSCLTGQNLIVSGGI